MFVINFLRLFFETSLNYSCFLNVALLRLTQLYKKIFHQIKVKHFTLLILLYMNQPLPLLLLYFSNSYLRNKFDAMGIPCLPLTYG